MNQTLGNSSLRQSSAFKTWPSHIGFWSGMITACWWGRKIFWCEILPNLIAKLEVAVQGRKFATGFWRVNQNVCFFELRSRKRQKKYYGGLVQKFLIFDLAVVALNFQMFLDPRCDSVPDLRFSAEDVWMDVVVKLFAVALVSCVSMSDAWKWAIAFSLGMAVLVGACQPYMWPQVGLTLRHIQYCFLQKHQKHLG